MQEHTICRGTTKYSPFHRRTVLKNLTRRYLRLLRLRTRALQHASRESTLFVACHVPLPEPSLREDEDLQDDGHDIDFLWLRSRLSSPSEDGRSVETPLDDYHDDASESRKRKRQNISYGSFRFTPDCMERTSMEVAMNDYLFDMLLNPRLGQLLSWKDTFPGMLEQFLNHIEIHCCPEVSQHLWPHFVKRENKEYSTFERHGCCVSLIHFNQLQDDIEDTYERMSSSADAIAQTSKRKGSESSRLWHYCMSGIRAERMKSSGLGSPLVESCTPDEFDFVYDSWESWNNAARPSRSVLVDNENNNQATWTGEQGQNSSAQYRIR